MIVEGTALLARLCCVLWSFAGDLVWDKRAGTGQHAQSQGLTGVGPSVLQQARGTAAFCDLCCPIRWQLRLRRDAPLSRAELLRPYCLIHCSRRCGWLCSRLASPPKPTPRIDFQHPWPQDLAQDNHLFCLDDEFAHCRSSPRTRSCQHNSKAWSEICLTEPVRNHLDASCKRESRLLCRGTAEHQLIVSPSVPSFWSQTTLKC